MNDGRSDIPEETRPLPEGYGPMNRCPAARACAALAFFLWLGGLSACGPHLAYEMVKPQVSTDNRYVGPQLEIQFQFREDRVRLHLFNTSDEDVLVNWDRATFVDADRRVVRLLSTGTVLSYTVPAGTRATVELAPAQYQCAESRIWNRRAPLKRLLVPAEVISRGVVTVAIQIPITRMDTDESVTDETLDFVFGVIPGEGAGNEVFYD